MASTTVTFPPSLMFLMSNFHNFVTIKLDSTNYMLWRIQVENIVSANGFFEYLDGSIECPASQVRNDEGSLISNSAYTMWKLIDTQLLSCLTASLSPTTLPYILGLHHAHEVWDSLSNRYNSLSKSNVQDLKSKLYNITKTSTIECYIDSIKEYAQKLAAAGSPIEEDDLIFHTLRGLPGVFNGLKTTVRAMQTSGQNIMFNDVVNMLKGEDLQLLQETHTGVDIGSVLVATNSHSTSHGKSIEPTSVIPSVLNPPGGQLGFSSQLGPTQSVGFSQFGYMPGSSQFASVPFSNQFGPSQQFSQSVPSFMPPQHGSQQFYQVYPQQSRGFNRGRGRGPRMQCDICGRTNHSTNYCHYRSPTPSYQWRPPGPWMNPMTNYPSGMPMFQPSFLTSQQPMVNSQQHGQNIVSSHQHGQHFTAPSSQNSSPHMFAGFTEAYSVPNMSCFPGYYTGRGFNEAQFSHGSQLPLSSAVGTSTSVGQPWYFDSGATNHITNNLQNLTNPQPANTQDGIMVGNGSHLQVSHTGKGLLPTPSGQEFPQNLVQGTLSQGTLSHSDLL